MRLPIFGLWHEWCNIFGCLRKMAQAEDLKGERKMNTIMNIDPWGFLDDLLGVPSRTFQAMRARAAGRFPPVNVFLDDNAVLLDLQLPGKTANDVTLTLEPEAVVIADKPAAEEGKEVQPAWSRRLDLPFRVNADKANAKFTDGILRIELPKAEKEGVKHIAIQ
jgi:HSP20 family protein